ncbi:hypothetical protein RHMOL_Rhmol12G0076300 [Rhododendron molle]|uniref:Uncharacterized protein n=1 Tax=Rhododendron molle TaxID=49168 RepID=A0ACC0LFU7_RHOML|nr:hypothetical protein RHMOL_Rhmol12G0076300 [Rhododendron molle]
MLTWGIIPDANCVLCTHGSVESHNHLSLSLSLSLSLCQDFSTEILGSLLPFC